MPSPAAMQLRQQLSRRIPSVIGRLVGPPNLASANLLIFSGPLYEFYANLRSSPRTSSPAPRTPALLFGFHATSAVLLGWAFYGSSAVSLAAPTFPNAM